MTGGGTTVGADHASSPVAAAVAANGSLEAALPQPPPLLSVRTVILGADTAAAAAAVAPAPAYAAAGVGGGPVEMQ